MATVRHSYTVQPVFRKENISLSFHFPSSLTLQSAIPVGRDNTSHAHHGRDIVTVMTCISNALEHIYDPFIVVDSSI